ncbi:MFS transporter [Bacillaceae bacterium Marseille-Q3522]|nr:MFS transporter [Bacillaceae bacterium Marseille-Q3522]
MISLLTFVLISWILWTLPDVSGQNTGKKPLFRVFVIPGIHPVLLVVLTWVLAHKILYTYIAPYLAPGGLSKRVDGILFLFGIASVVGNWLIGVWIDRRLRLLVLISLIDFAFRYVSLTLC